jgi:hypothetical protein
MKTVFNIILKKVIFFLVFSQFFLYKQPEIWSIDNSGCPCSMFLFLPILDGWLDRLPAAIQ